MVCSGNSGTDAIRTAFGLRKGDALSFVGAGGKTSLITAFAKAFSAECAVAVTTTTKMVPFENPAFENVLTGREPLEAAIERVRKNRKIGAFFGTIVEGRKCTSPGVATLQRLAKAFDILLIEADGARGGSLKLPRTHEPVVPDFSNKVAWVTGLDVLGRRLNEARVFHPEVFAAAGFDGDMMLDIPNLRKVLYGAGGYVDRLAGKDVTLCLTKSDLFAGDTDKLRGLFNDRLMRILLTSTIGGVVKIAPLDNREVPVCGIVLCAGRAERFGGGKMTASVNGKPMAMHAIEAAVAGCSRLLCVPAKDHVAHPPRVCPGGQPGGAQAGAPMPHTYSADHPQFAAAPAAAAPLDKIYAVVNNDSAELRKLIESRFGDRVGIVVNREPEKGLSSSIKLGAKRARKDSRKPPAMMFFLGDMPFVNGELAEKVLGNFRESCAEVCAPKIAERFGHPAVLHPSLFGEVMQLDGDVGCREIIRRHADLVRTVSACEDSQKDFDFREDVISGERPCRISSGA
jgi:molybdenum cofactor cytidylyltransferase